MALRDVQAMVTITSNATKAIDDGKKLKKVYADIKQELNEMKAAGKTDTKAFKELQKLAEDTEARIKALVTGMKLIEGVMANIANKQGKDLNRALRETSREFNKTDNATGNGKRKLEQLREAVAALKRELSDRRGLTMSLQDAQKQLSNLGNVSLDRLKTGIAAINSELEKPLSKMKRLQMEMMQAKYQAAIAVRQTPITQTPVSSMNAAQLRNEQSALTSALAATQGVKGYEAQATQYASRLKAVNEQLKLMAQNEREADQAAKQLTATQQASDVVLAVYRKQAVSVEELKAAYKTLQQRAEQFTGINPAKAAAARRNMQMIDQEIKRLTGDLLTEKQIEDRVANSRKYSVQQLQQAYNQLQQKLQTLNATQVKDIQKTKQQMATLKNQIDSVTGAVNTQNQVWKTAVRNITAYMGVFAAFNWVKTKVQEVFKGNEQLSDSLANIRKVSGLTSGEINELYTNIAKIDTRNSVEQLNNLAYAGAKLGIGEYGVKGLTGFVKAAEQVQMALGEDLGEDALPALAKLTEVMGLITQYGVEEAMQKAASSIFMLSTTSTSTGTNIVEFSKRLMGLANVSHVTADELLALGSASDAMGLMPEVSATAFNKVLTKIQSNTKGIEQSLGLANGELKQMVDNGKTMEAIVKVFDTMRDMSMEEMQRRGIFKELGSDGARLNNVMTTMADRVDMLKKHLDTAHKSFEEGEAVIAEYMIQNQTAAAYMERAANQWQKAFVNPEGVDAVTDFAKQWHELTMELTQSTIVMGQMKAALYMVLTAVKALIYVLPTLITFLLFKGSLTAITAIYYGFVNMGKAIWACVTASKALTAAQKWNGITTVLSLIAAAFLTWKSAADEAAEATERARERQEELDKQFAASKDTISKSIKPLEDYKKALDEANLSQEERDKRLKAYLKNEYQPYLDYLGIEIDKVEDLADAYAQVVLAMKQKTAAEEKESYKNNVLGDTKNNRIAAQAEVIREAKKQGLIIDKAYLEKYQYLGLDKLYRQIMESAIGVKATRQTGKNLEMYSVNGKFYNKDLVQVSKGDRAGWEYASNEDLYNAVNKYITLFRDERDTNKKIEEMFNEEYKDLDLENFSLEEFRKKQLEAQIEREKNRKETVLPTLPDKEAEKEEKERLRKELQDAKRESDAVISKIEEWYRLQESAITDMAADGRLTQEQAEQATRALNVAKNTALRDARLAISGRDTETWEKTKQQIGQLMLDHGKWSSELLEQILGVSMETIRRNLANIDKGGGQYGITTTALKDAIDKNAAGNQREIAKLLNKSREEVEKLLMKYEYFQQATLTFAENLTKIGALSVTVDQLANNLNGVPSAQQTIEAAKSMLAAVIRQGAGIYAVNPSDAQGVANVLRSATKDAHWFDLFPAVKDWLANPEAHKKELEQIFNVMLIAEQDYYTKRKQSYEAVKKQQTERFRAAGFTDQEAQTDQALETRGKMQDAGIGASFWQQQGLGSIANDPEIMRIQNRIYWRNEEVKAAEARLEAIKAQQAEEIRLAEERGATLEQLDQLRAEQAAARMGFEDLLKEKQTALFEQETNMAIKVAQELQKRVQTINSLTKPVQDFTGNVGQKMGEMLQGMKENSMTWNEIFKNMEYALAESVIQMGAQYAQNVILNAAANRAMEADDAAHTIFTVQAGIAAGSAKTIGAMGWLGLALIPVISALLLGLLKGALLSKPGSDSSSSSSNSNTKTKLVSGMLTYDEGNSYVGTDGHVYSARAAALPSGVGMVTSPIATTVNGDAALVGEKGPELVIGRRATRHIQMNEPGLLHHLAALNGRFRTHRTFDEGNVSAAMPDAEASGTGTNAAALDALTAVVAQLSQTVTALQQKGVPAYINKYGTGGLIDEVKSGLKFDKKYGG